jgi:hypothetical protein
LSTSKKPGTDLAALKARLAKKTKGKEEPVAATAPPAAQAYAPASDALPPPGYSAPPRAEHYPDPHNLPPPGVAAHQYAPPAQPPASMAASHAAPAVAPPSDDPFAGGPAASFDPDPMLDVGGEVQSKSGFGLMIFAGLLGAAFGVAAGFLGHKMVENRERYDKGQTKGAEMAEAVGGVVSARIDVSNAMEGLEKKMAEDPKAAAADIETLLSDKWEGQVSIAQLFGWQLAAVHPNGVKRTFELFEEATRVKKDLQYLQAFLASQPEELLKGQGPSQFAVMFTSSGANLVAALEPLCAAAEEGAAPAPCSGGDFSKAVAYRVIDAIGGEPKVVPRGTGEGQATLVASDGGVYAYAVGLEPNRNAVIYRNGLVQRVKEHLEAMVKAEKFAAKALEKYAEDPTVDGSVEQPDPEAGAEGQ